MFSTATQETPAQRAAFYTAKAQSFEQQAQSAPFAFQRTDLAERAAKYLRFAAFALSTAEAQAAPVEVAPLAAPVEAQPVKPKPVRSERVQAMRRFYAVAASHKLSTRDAQAMTAALAKYLCCIIPSRSILSSGQWCEAAEAVELGLLAW